MTITGDGASSSDTQKMSRMKYMGKQIEVRDVWKDNLEQEMEVIRETIDRYPIVAMDTEFPGQITRPVNDQIQRSLGTYQYHLLRANVNVLNLIQIGFCFFNEEGHLPEVNGVYVVWQFNFKEFDPESQPHALDSIELLEGAGINFATFRERGVSVNEFAKLLTISGVVLNEDVKWVTFHSSYDFGYLVKALMGGPLPETQTEFHTLLRIFFPRLFDIKYIIRFVDSLYGGLAKLAERLEVERIGPQHQAGSDSLLTCQVFQKLEKEFFMNTSNKIDRYEGILYGLSEEGNDIKDSDLLSSQRTQSVRL